MSTDDTVNAFMHNAGELAGVRHRAEKAEARIAELERERDAAFRRGYDAAVSRAEAEIEDYRKGRNEMAEALDKVRETADAREAEHDAVVQRLDRIIELMQERRNER